MPRELYNEGRVVGYSAYELYVKHALSEFPDEEPASEREWLAAQLGSGASLILRIPVERESVVSGVHHVDFKLPSGTKLLAANTIIGSQFFGSCKFSAEGWATKVTDYGKGIANTSTSSPSTQTDASRYPSQEAESIAKDQLLQYLKIQDAVVLQPGIWENTSDGEPLKDFKPYYSGTPIVRITFSSRITTEFYVLLTGFINHTIIAGITGIDQGSTNELKPENGDFLGPELYPWSNKVIFMQPPIATFYLRKHLSSGHENRQGIDNTDAGTTRVNNLKIEHNEDSINTIFTSSYLYSADGITLVGPTTEGGNITIGSKIGSTGNAANYLKVTQTHSDASHKQATDLQHSKITAGRGIAYHTPKNPADEVKLSAMIATANNYLQVRQMAKPDITSSKINITVDNNKLDVAEFENERPGTDEKAVTGYTTLLIPSTLKSTGGLAITQPGSPGADIKISAPMSVTQQTNALRITQGITSTTFRSVIASSNKYINVIADKESDGTNSGRVSIGANIDNIIKATFESDDATEFTTDFLRNNLIPGPGIAISENSGRFMISAGSSSNTTTLHLLTDYRLHWYNNFYYGAEYRIKPEDVDKPVSERPWYDIRVCGATKDPEGNLVPANYTANRELYPFGYGLAPDTIGTEQDRFPYSHHWKERNTKSPKFTIALNTTPIRDDDGTLLGDLIVSAEIHIGTGATHNGPLDTYAGNPDVKPTFEFKHAKILKEGYKSWIFWFNFQKKTIYECLNPYLEDKQDPDSMKSAFDLYVSDNLGLWNVSRGDEPGHNNTKSYGGSFNVELGMARQIRANDNDNQGYNEPGEPMTGVPDPVMPLSDENCGYVLYAGRIADGYNGQYHTGGRASDQPGQKYIYVESALTTSVTMNLVYNHSIAYAKAKMKADRDNPMAPYR